MSSVGRRSQDKILVSPSIGNKLGLYTILDSRLGAVCFKEFVEKTDAYQRIPNLLNPLIYPSSSTSSDLPSFASEEQ